MDKKLIQTIAETLEKFDFVQWDRFIDLPNHIQIYGWMDRVDDYKDFLLLTYRKDTGSWGYTNSSVKNISKIKKILGIKEGGTYQCQRVEHTFDINNSIKLTNK